MNRFLQQGQLQTIESNKDTSQAIDLVEDHGYDYDDYDSFDDYDD